MITFTKSAKRIIRRYFLNFYFKRLLLLGLVTIFFIIQFNFFRQHTQAFYFGDESEHLVPGWLMANYGKKLYTDISTNHQPIPIFASYVFIKTIHFENLFMLVERIRQFVFIFSFFAAAFFVLSFGPIGLIAVILIEIIKFYFFGYYILAESLAVYPVMIITGLILKMIFKNKIKRTKADNIVGENLLFGFSTFFSAFSLITLWPFLILSTSVYLFYQKKRSKLITISAFLIPVCVLFTFIDFKMWFVETIYNVVKYFIPYESQTKTFIEKVSLLLYPFQSFLHLNSIVSRYIAVLTLLALSSSIILIRQKRRVIYMLFLLYTLLILLNLRIPKTNIGFYEAFHVLPFIGGLTIMSLTLASNSLKVLKHGPYKYYLTLVIFLFVILLISSSQWWREKPDKFTDHYVQYSERETEIYVLSNVKFKGDRLWVSPLDGMVNIISDMPLADRQNAHLSWAYRVPKLKNEFQYMIQHNPPTFVLFYNQDDEYYSYMYPYLKNEYTNFQSSDGKPTKLYILNTAISKRSSDQWRAAGLRDFLIP